MPDGHQSKHPPEQARIAESYRYYAEDPGYAARWNGANPGERAIVDERHQAVLSVLLRGGLPPIERLRILDVGCGRGTILSLLRRSGASDALLHGVDLLPERISEARRAEPSLDFQLTSAEELPYASESFDMVLLMTVMTSILDTAMATRVAREVDRVLQSGGAILWYDFRYSNPRNQRVRSRTLRDIEQLFPSYRLQLRTITLLPPLARRLGRLTGMLYPALSVLPWLRSHYFGLLIKPGQTTRAA